MRMQSSARGQIAERDPVVACGLRWVRRKRVIDALSAFELRATLRQENLLAVASSMSDTWLHNFEQPPGKNILAS
jgi:hypothetical protein